VRLRRHKRGPHRHPRQNQRSVLPRRSQRRNPSGLSRAAQAQFAGALSDNSALAELSVETFTAADRIRSGAEVRGEISATRSDQTKFGTEEMP
jgi:hypothetical protein